MRPWFWLSFGVALAGLPSATARAQVTFVDDPLTGPPSGASAGVGVGQRGGSFGPGGWTTTGPTDAIWYTLPGPVPRGRLEFTLTNAGNSTTLLPEEMEILSLYGETDQPEPISYMPYHRSNDFKAQVPIFGLNAGDPPGSMSGSSKLELRLCNAGWPGWHETCPAGCVDTYSTSYLGCTWCPLTWDPGAAYRIVVEWGFDANGGWMTYTRGVESAVRIDHPGTYAPQSLRVMLGNPRNGAASEMPVGVTYRDVKVTGEPGAATQSCVPSGPDAGAPPGPDAAAAAQLRAVSLDPNSGSGTSQVFRAVYGSSAGASTFRIAQLWVGPAPAVGGQALAPAWEQGRFHLGTDSCAPGEARTLQTPLGGLECQGSSAAVDAELLTVQWRLTFEPSAFAGSHGVWFDAKGGPGSPEPRLGWTQMGTFTVPPATDAGAAPRDAGSTSQTGDAASADASALSPPDAGSRSDGGAFIPGAGVNAACGCAAAAGPALGWTLFVLATWALRRRTRGPSDRRSA